MRISLYLNEVGTAPLAHIVSDIVPRVGDDFALSPNLYKVTRVLFIASRDADTPMCACLVLSLVVKDVAE